jgi:hypothetical protein
MTTREWQLNIELTLVYHEVTGVMCDCLIENVGPQKVPHWLEVAISDACDNHARELYDAAEDRAEQRLTAQDAAQHEGS